MMLVNISHLFVLEETKILRSLIIVMSFISVLPIPQRFIPDWNSNTLRYFCPMLAIAGIIFGALWLLIWQMLSLAGSLSPVLRGMFMTLLTLALTGGLHLDGLMDSCDAIFSRRDRQTRLAILSDPHAGSFAVMGCVVMLLAKTLLFSEMLTLDINPSLVPIYSRLGMAVLLNNLPFAKSGGLAVMLGSSRSQKHNIFFALMMIMLLFVNPVAQVIAFIVILLLWRSICLRIFGGITGDLLGAFVELSELFMLTCMVIGECI